jgi:hypothetical protein
MIRAGCVLLLLALAAPAAEAHGWYFGLHDAAGRSCCNDQDCRPVGLCVLPDRKEGLLIEGACRPIPWDKVLGVVSPDGGAHACWNHVTIQPNLLCVILPGQV